MYIAVFFFRVQKTIDSIYQNCTRMYPSPERQWRCSETTVSLRHVVLETTGVVWAVCECFPSIFWSSDRFLQCPTCGYDVQMPSKLKLNQDI